MKDKRKLRRRNLIYYLEIYNTTTGQLFGRLVDITSEGIMIVCDEPKDLNRMYGLKMLLPDNELGKEDITFMAKSVWCKKDVNPQYYVTGFKLFNVVPEDRVIINRLIDRKAFE